MMGLGLPMAPLGPNQRSPPDAPPLGLGAFKASTIDPPALNPGQMVLKWMDFMDVTLQ